MSVTRFRHGKRVLVRAVCPRPHAEPIAIPPTMGTVSRLLSRDGSAWITLDERLDLDVHPFPETDDSRHTHVLAWPEDCEPTREVAR